MYLSLNAHNALREEKGNLSLEHILFIVAVAGISTAVSAFYGDIATWFEGITLPGTPSLQ